MEKNLDSTTKLTEFAPLSPEPEDSPGFGYLLSKIFKRNNGNDVKQPTLPTDAGTSDLPVSTDTHWQDTPEFKEICADPNTSLHDKADQYRIENSEGRSLPNVLKRISNLLALTNSGYKDTELKQYWMPDSVSKECYDCGEKFTTFRRRHHCRVCGQIFCSRCCNREIPGKLMGFTRMQNSLRVCTYCGKVVLSYLQSADMGADMTADLRALQEDLQTKFGNSSGSSAIVSLASSQTTNVSNYSSSSGEREEPVKRKPSVGYQEEKFVQGRNFGGSTLSGLDENNGSNQALRSLYDELVHPNRGITIGIHKHKLQSYPNCFTGSELVDWLMLQNRASIRAQGAAISQTLLDSNFIECVTREFAQFCDGYTLYRLCTIRSPSRTPPLSIITHSDQEELWPPDTPQDSTTTDSESECPPSETNLPSSASLFRLDLNLEDSTVHISRPPQQPSASASKKSKSTINKAVPNTKTNEGDKHVHAVVQSYREGTIQAPHIVNWHKVYPHQLRADNGEKQAYEALNSGFNLHLQGFLKQVLNREGLSQSWADIVVPLAHQVVDSIKPDLRTDTDDMDIRKYVQLKKVSGGIRSDSCIVAGVVCCKNLAHRAMPTRLTNPRILLLSCAIVYQRIEGRLMSLEPVMMQEQEYLRHVVARIAALEPDLVLVQKNVSRLAQESLLKLGITLALNVKPSVLERVARVTKADILKSIDAQVGGRPQLGTCKYFYVKTFTTENDIPKTLMFLEGCSSPHLGCTVLLRGAPTSELAKLKRVASWLIFAVYNWRLERSFLMDEFANPPTVSVDNFFEDIPSSEKKKKLQDSKSVDSLKDKFGLPVTTSSPMEEVTGVLNGSPASMQLFQPSKIDDENNRVHNRLDDIESSRSRKVAIKTSSEIEFDSKKGLSVSEYNPDKLNEYSSKNNSRLIIKDKSLSDERKMNVESISDFSDPLHQYLNLEDEVFSEHPTGQALSVEELPQPNRFRQALDDTILSVSPFLKFCVPYLETESGRNCRLRQYFPKEVYWSAQLTDHAAVGRTASVDTFHKDIPNKLNGTVLAPKHPYVTTKLTSPSKSREVQTLLANFRAVGGRLQLPDKSNETTVVPVTTVQTVSTVASPIDALDPSKHQRLAVLFCSYSSVSHNAPAFCVNPWVVHMDFYGRNDIPLGAFLERYCFRTSYVCPSEDCDTPMLSHIRRFVHDGGAVHISLKEIEVPPQTDDSVIIMWSWCPQCNLVSPIMPMSPDTWSLSFAKYLELRCHGSIYSTRGLADSACKHSLHQDCCQFFGYKNLVATFQYTKIAVWEISLPSLMLVTQRVQHNIQQNSILEEVKKWSLNGYEVFSAILSKLCNLAVIGEGVPALKLQLQKEQAVFKSLVEEIQVRLTSPTLENKSFFPSNEDSITISLWQLEDSLVLLKRHIAEAVAKWNITLAELETTIHTKKREEKNKKSQPDNKSVSSAGLSDIIEGMISSHFTEAHLLGDDGLPKESEGKILPSQLSQTSLHSALEVDVEESSDLVYSQDSISETIPTEKPHDDKMDTDSHHEISIDESAAIFCSTDMNEIEQQENAVKSSESGEFVCGYEEPISLQEESTNKILYSDSDNEHLLENDEGEPAGVVVKSQPSDKISVKTILSQLLPIAPTSTPIQCPMSPQEHHCLPLSMSVPVVVYDSELSSIIAYALGSNEYRKGLTELRAKNLSSIDQHSPSPIVKRKSGGSDSSRENSTDLNNVGKPGMLSFLRSATVNSNSNITTGLSVRSSNEGIQYSSINSSDSASHTPMETDEAVKVEAETTKGKTNKSQSSSDLEIPFSDVSTTFTVKIYYADEFARLRETIFPAGEEAYIRSLSRSIQWAARGGKSGSNFAKTKDDRFILKEMSRTETHPFMESAPQYFAYMNNCVASKSPTLLGKIVGVYRVRNSNNTSRSNLLVMENLFHGRSVRNKFDLKGSVRNRLVNPNEQEGEIVLLDENLINMTCDNPLYMLPHSKTVLMQAIHNDTKFLASLSVMDYSLLVGQDEKNKELVVGIIDYIRTFTWDKKLETMVKKSGLLGGQGKLPTIVSPDEYRDRFIAAMHRYFLPVPDRWIGLGYTSMWEILLSYISRLRRKGKYSREFNLEHEDDKVMYTKKAVQ